MPWRARGRWRRAGTDGGLTAAARGYNRNVAEARRTVCRWLLAALLERGPQQVIPAPESPRLERVLSAHEARRLLGPSRLAAIS